MFYEFRTYTCAPGKLAAALKRFETVTVGLFDKHRIQRRAWMAFRADPEWQKALAETDKDGPLVQKIANELLAAAPFSLK